MNMDVSTLVAIVQGLMGLLMAIGGYLYRDVKAKADKTHEEFLVYRTFVASTYINNEELRTVVENFSRGLDNVAASMLRVESRLNTQLDRRMDRDSNNNQH